MDAYEATKVVLSRLQAMDPENAARIMGLLLSQDNGGAEMIRLAMAPDSQLLAAAGAARRDVTGTPPSPSPPPQPRVLPSPLAIPSSSSYSLGPGEATDSLIDDLSFLDGGVGGGTGSGDGLFAFDGHRRSSSVSDVLNGGDGGFGWKPCLYYMRGFCKNGSACRFIHGDDLAAVAGIEQELLLRSKSHRLSSSTFPYSPTGSSISLPGSPSGKCLNFLLQQQQQNESQRVAAAAAALMLNSGEDAQRFMSRPRLDFATLMNPGARQIYLTFPADSTFREEDVSSYFSIYGPVQDVRIPYQQKRMFGFVTFVYPETVKLILAKGNPHFICDARVLVKPYKEKGKVPEKFRKPHGDFAGCLSPTGLVDPRDPFDIHQLGLGARLMHSNSANELMIRRKLEEQQAAAELQQAIELQSRRLMNLQLLDLKTRSMMLPPDSGGEHAKMSSIAMLGQPVNAGADKGESNSDGSPSASSDFQESAEHNLPESPFASPTKSMFALDLPGASTGDTESAGASNRSNGSFLSAVNGNGAIGSGMTGIISSNLRLPPLDIPSPKPYFPVSRLAADHGAIGM